MENFYSITPLASFNASNEEIQLPYCSINKLTREQLDEYFTNLYGNLDGNNLCVGELYPTKSEMEDIENSYFLCFKTKQLHDDHFHYTAKALRLFQKIPAITTETFREDGASGSLERWFPPECLPELKDIPEFDVPNNLKQIHNEFRTYNEGDDEYNSLYMKLREWWLKRYRKFHWEEGTEDEFIKLEDRLRKLYFDEKDNPIFRYLRNAINWYMIAQDQRYIDPRIVFSCMILELLCLKHDGARGKGNKLANAIHVLLPGSDQEKRAAKKLMGKKYYGARNKIMHGFAYDDQTLDINEYEIGLMFDVCRKIILLMLEKSIEEKKDKDQIIKIVELHNPNLRPEGA